MAEPPPILLDEKSPPCSQRLCLAAPRPTPVNSAAAALPSNIKEKVSYLQGVSYLWEPEPCPVEYPVPHSLLGQDRVVRFILGLQVSMSSSSWASGAFPVKQKPQAAQHSGRRLPPLPAPTGSVSRSSPVPGVLLGSQCHRKEDLCVCSLHIF